MFSCDYCNYQIASNKIMEMHKGYFHKEDTKYRCDICDYQESNKKSMQSHKKRVHTRVKYSCIQCNHQTFTKKGIAHFTGS